MKRDINPFGLRMPQQLKEMLQKAADASGESMNSEIVRRLEHSLRIDEAYSSIFNNYQLLLRQQHGNQNVIRNQAALSTMLTKLYEKLQTGISKADQTELSKLIRQANAAAHATVDVAKAVKAGIDDGTFSVPPETMTDYLTEYLEDKDS